ncbi:MAG: hypothetical protein LBH53_03600 [Puniceicoccales bacterium]|nr:hypothetical protein [Puniceicoccales bacterium]
MLAAEISIRSGLRDIGVFCAIDGQKERIGSGSPIRLSGLSLVAGVIHTANGPLGPMRFGEFLEYSHGETKTVNKVAAGGTIFGDGKVDALGVGGFFKMAFPTMGIGRPRVDGLLRLGELQNKWKSKNLGGDGPAKFSGTPSYQSIQFGVSYGANLWEKYSIDLYGRYFWTRLDERTLDFLDEEQATFQALNSHRLRFGGRLRYAIDYRLMSWCESYFEREMAGTAKGFSGGSTNFSFPLKGNCGTCAVGVAYRPIPTAKVHVALRGSVGSRKGIDASLQASYEF